MLQLLAVASALLLPACSNAVFVDVPAKVTSAHATTASPYHLLQPSSFAGPLGDDLAWASENIPLMESANSTLDLVYYFRWRTYKSHIHNTSNASVPYVVTEFSPKVPWAGKYNTINCAAGHHMLEGGWLRQPAYMDSYTRWWVNTEARHNYFYWFASALKANYDRAGNATLPLLRDVVPLYLQQFKLYANGSLPGGSGFSEKYDCLWNFPGNEGQEQSLSGPGCRPLVQSLMFGEARALSVLCAAIGDDAGALAMGAEADRWQRRVLKLWNPAIDGFDTLQLPIQFLKPLPPSIDDAQAAPADTGGSTGVASHALPAAGCIAQKRHCRDLKCMCITVNANNTACCFARVRELASLSSPWYFGAVPKQNASAYASSWNTAFDAEGLAGEFGLRTAERRHPGYFCDNSRPGRGPHGRPSNGCCKWSGPMWPFETAKAISAAITIINEFPTVETVDRTKLWSMLWQYVAAHTPLWKLIDVKDGEYLNRSSSTIAEWMLNGTDLFWLAESGCADSGNRSAGLSGPAWTDDAEQGYEYNHSTFIDLILSGLVGLQPDASGKLTVNPLIPPRALSWWTVDGIQLHGRSIAVSFDADGKKYQRGPGLRVWVDGVLSASSSTMTKLSVQL